MQFALKVPIAMLGFAGMLLLGPLLMPCADEAVTGSAKASVPAVLAVDPAKAADHLKKGNVIVLDIRTPAEFAQGHLHGATNIDFTAKDFNDRVGKLDRDKTYLLHCATGRRSTLSLPTFEKQGFKSILHLEGGIKAWREAGQPLEKD